MPKRSRSPTSTERDTKRPKPSRLRFVWSPKDWKFKSKLNSKVTLLERQTGKECVVKKVLRLPPKEVPDRRPLEIRLLSKLPRCNRVVKPIFFSNNDPDPLHATLIYTHYKLGDLENWTRKSFFDHGMPVLESSIWRFFIQISQGLAFVQNEIGPQRDQRKCLLIRDIKPENILVTENGTTYPSFKLHDFDCSTWYEEEIANKPDRCGSFMWQPPENPIINTTAADIWGLGACIHYMAVQYAPLGDINQFEKALLKNGKARPKSVEKYPDLDDYCFARVPRKVTPINLSKAQQEKGGYWPSKQQYSDELNDWMSQCLSKSPDCRPTALRLTESMSIVATKKLEEIGGQAALVDLDINFG